MDLIARLDNILLEQHEPTIIDQTNQTEAMEALRNCRAPVMGYDDYMAGDDYQPPMFYNSDVPMGPRDTMGNVHSEKYGGVRPWEPNEVLIVLLNAHSGVPLETGDRDTEGLIWTIAKKGTVRNSFLANQGMYEIEDAVALGSSAALRAIYSDEGRLGVRFTSHIGSGIEEGMRSGVPPGYRDEYRKSRGYLRRFETEGKRALRNINAAGVEREPDDPGPARNELATINNIVMGLNPEPGPRNELGFLVTRIIEVGNALSTAIANEDAEATAHALEMLQQTRDDIEEQERSYKERGAKTGTLITKSKEQAPIKMKGITVQSKKSGKELERPDTVDRQRQNEKGQWDTVSAALSADNPEIKETMEQVVRILRSGRGSGKGWVAMQARRVFQTLADVIAQIDNPPPRRTYEKVAGTGATRGDFVIRDVETGEVVGSHHEEYLADQHLLELQANPLLTTVRSIADGVTHREFGDYAAEIMDIVGRLETVFKTNDRSGLEEISEDLADLDVVAAEDEDRGEADVTFESVSPQEYRVLLRLFGVSNYPERGTVEDPEIDENGRLSKWARGELYIIDDETGEKQAVGGPYAQVVNNAPIADDLGISQVRISQYKKSIVPKVERIFKFLQQDLYESGQIDDFDYMLLTEVRVSLGKQLMSEIMSSTSGLLVG